ncbi:body wall muscle protein HR-29 [Galendromus occidentalis]|uniref:Body wall muscle protein HR-29 n=1 Tax=Galendromus occidentalis TaxID=34638 RepID=A0AAJ6VY34_9ACAR|nr:body wall muscle protein HR-29 [Galendromus occidentalis]
MAPERRLHISRTEHSILDNEFSNVRERFDQEMRWMEDEMERFRTQLRDHDVFSKGPTSQARTYFDLNSPLIQETANGREIKLRFDVSNYAPEEIVVKTVDNKLFVHAKHEEKSETKSVFREYKRDFMLPKGVSPERITSSLSRDGVLTITAPLPAIEEARGEKMIPIAHH